MRGLFLALLLVAAPIGLPRTLAQQAAAHAVPPPGIPGWLAGLEREGREARDAYDAFKDRMQQGSGLTWAIQASWFLQAASPDGGLPVSQFVLSPSLAWQPFTDTAWGSGRFDVAATGNRGIGRLTTPMQQQRIGTITPPNEWGADAWVWDQVTYSHTLPGPMDWLTLAAGQYAIAAFDGNPLAAGAQTGFVTYALAQNATQIYPQAGLGAFASVVPPGLPVTLAAGFQGAEDIPGTTITTRGLRDGRLAWFASLAWTPTVPGLGQGRYAVLVYSQPSVPDQPSGGKGVSLSAVQPLGSALGVFLRANQAGGSAAAIATSFAGGLVLNDPFARQSSDALGLGVFANRANQAALGPAATSRSWETGAEAYYNLTLTRGLQVTPDIALFRDPVLAPQRDLVWLFTLRATAFF